MSKYMTKKWAKEVIENERETNAMYFDGSFSFESLYDMFRYQYRFDHHETMLVLASLVNSGCKFR